MKKITMLWLLSVCLMSGLHAQSPSNLGELKVGLRIQKAQKLYWENGLGLDYTNPKFLDSRLHLGASYATSRLGSALGTNAIKQDHYLVNVAYHFRHQKQLQPFARLNLGYFYADYEDAVFDVLPHSAFMTSIDAGISYEFKFPLTLNLSAGYNLNAGTGVAGPGTLFPIFYQLSFLYTIF